MLLRRAIPPELDAWNLREGAPSGHASLKRQVLRRSFERLGRTRGDAYLKLGGPFSLQGNNDTRLVEYPWAFSATALGEGVEVVEIGGALSGLQFVLSRTGCHVVNVDPGEDDVSYWALTLPLDPTTMARLNRVFGTDVELRKTVLQDAGIADRSVDRVFSISAIEHIPAEELPDLARHIARILRPGGQCVLTIDLFLDLAPFTTKQQNFYGRNADVRAFVEDSGLELVVGAPEELHGYDEFDPQSILSRLGEFFIGSGYPVCAQACVLEKH